MPRENRNPPSCPWRQANSPWAAWATCCWQSLPEEQKSSPMLGWQLLPWGERGVQERTHAAAAWPGSELLLWLLLLGQELLLALNGICFPFFTVAAVVILTGFFSLVCKKTSQYKLLFWGPTAWLFAVGCSEQRYWAGCVTEGTEKGNLHRSIQRGVKQFCKTEDAVWLCASALLTRPPLLPVIIIFKVCVGS